MQRQSGFTTVELISAVLLILILVTLSLTRESNSASISRDVKRKTAINAMYYNLEEVFYRTNKYYPLKLDANKLSAMDPALLKDPRGSMIGEQASEYRYEPVGCSVDKCTGYTLRADLERESDYTKRNR